MKNTSSQDERRQANRTNAFIFNLVSSWLLWLFFCGFCFALSGCVGDMVSRSAPLSLIASANSINLGSVPVGNTASATLSLVNKNPVAVNITHLNLTGQSFSIGSQINLPVSIAAGRTYGLAINFNPAAPGPAAGQLRITSDDPADGPMLINVSGVGAAAQPAPKLTAIQCSTGSLTGPGADACTLTISAAAPSGGFTVSLSSNNTAVTVPATVTIPSNATSVQFTANVTSVLTPQEAALSANANGASENFALQLNAYVPALNISATNVSFGNVTLDTAATQSLTLTSVGTAPVTISAATPTGTGFSVQGTTFPLTMNPGISITLTLQFDPTASGQETGRLTLTSNSSPTGITAISLTGTGTSTSSVAVSIAPANVSIAVGTTQQFTASVTGTSNVDVLWTLSGTGCSETACGTISSGGLYTAPEVPPSPATISITGTSQVDPGNFASAEVTITSYLATATVSETPGRTVPSDFLGLSHEWGMAEFFAGTAATGKNLQYRQLLQNLLQYSSGPMVIRIGGNSTDTTVSLRPIDLESVNDLNADLKNNLRFTLGINMESDDPTIAAAETKAISAAIPSTSLIGLELGNEPDCWAAKGYRPATFSFAEYEAQLMTWIQLVADASDSQLNSVSPAFCLTSWVPGYQELLPSNNLIPQLVTQHYYAGEYLVTQPKRFDFLLADDVATSGPTKLTPYISAAHKAGKTFRIGEMNSLSNGGQPNVSDAFASALWGVDIMFEFAHAGADGVNWHTSNGGGYGLFKFDTKIDPTTGLTDYSLIQVRPLFYGLQLFEDATSSNGALLPTTVNTEANVKMWALMGEDGLVRVVILNKDETHTGTVKLTIPGYVIGTVSRLLAPSLSATTQITLGNQTYDGSVDGTMQGQLQTEQITAVDGSLMLTMPAVSAALITASKQ